MLYFKNELEIHLHAQNTARKSSPTRSPPSSLSFRPTYYLNEALLHHRPPLHTHLSLNKELSEQAHLFSRKLTHFQS